MSESKQPNGKRFSFTKSALGKLPLPESGRAEYLDTKTPGLNLRVTCKGKRTFSFFRRVNGQLIRMTLGEWPAMTVDQARTAATAAMAKAQRGKDPREAKRQARNCPLVRDLFDFYLEQHAKPHKKTWPEDQAQYERYIKAQWSGRKVDSIRRADVATLHTKIGAKHGPYAANRVRSLLHTMFALGIDAELFKGPNPVTGVKKFREESRDRFLDADELQRFFQALDAEPHEVIRDYLTLALLVGARKKNLLAMRWDDLHVDRGVWRIPDTKAGEAQIVVLSAAAVAVLQRRLKSRSDGCPWVFPTTGNHPSKSGHLQDPTIVWNRVLAAAGLKDVRLHDLRRTLASWQALTGSSELVIAKTLGHAMGSRATAVYARLTTDPVRESVEKATAAIMAAAAPKKAETERQGSDHE